MALFTSSFGIDIKQQHLILTLLKRSFGTIRLVDSEIHTLPPLDQKEEREAQIISLVSSFTSRHLISKARFSISIPREEVIVRFLRLPIATKENLRKVLEYETPKYTPFEKGEIYFDYFILKEEREWVHLFVVFAKKNSVDSHLSMLRRIGIQPLYIQIPSVSAVNLFYYNRRAKEEDPSVLIDLGEAFIEVNLLQERMFKESLHFPLPQGGREGHIVNLLRRSGQGRDGLSRSILFVYGLGSDDQTIASLKETDGFKGVFLPPLTRIKIEKREPEPYRIYSSVGLPLVGLARTEIGLNLLPLEMRKKVRKIRKPLLIFCAVFLLILSLVWGTRVYVRYKNELKAVNAEIKKRRPEVEAGERLQKQNEELRREISELEKIKAEEPSKIEILRELTQQLPQTAWIWQLRYTGKEIEIQGFADSASDLIPLLDKSALFEKVEFLAPVTKERVMRGTENVEKERFRIKIRYEGRRAGP
jgi:general secretion pathway protein L